MRPILLALALLCCPDFGTAESLPASATSFLTTHCLDCHSSDSAEGEIVLDTFDIDWSSHDSLALWERVINAIKSGEMPPPEASELSDDDRSTMVAWINDTLIAKTSIGGTLPRRLNQSEYKKSIGRLFGIKNFQLPPGFPIDREHHGFDNLGEGLVLSPPLMESYAESARLVADEIFPPPREAVEPTTYRAEAKDLVISYSSGKVVDGAMRLGLKCDPIHRSCTWPSRIETQVSGLYTFKIDVSAFQPGPDADPMVLKVFARDVASPDGVSHKSLPLLHEATVTSETPTRVEFEAVLDAGQPPPGLVEAERPPPVDGDPEALAGQPEPADATLEFGRPTERSEGWAMGGGDRLVDRAVALEVDGELDDLAGCRIDDASGGEADHRRR